MTAAEGTDARPVKIVFAMLFGERRGGAEHSLWLALRRFDRRRVEPLVLFFEDGPFRAEVEALGVRTALVRTGRLRQLHRGLTAVARIALLLGAEQPDLIVSWITMCQIYVSPAALVVGQRRRVVWWQHLLDEEDLSDSLAQLLPAAAIGTFSRCVQEMQDRRRPRRPTVRVTPGVEDPPRLSTEARVALRVRLGIPSQTFLVGTVGRLQRWKGHHHVIEAVARLRGRGHPIHLVVIGGGAHGFEPEYFPELEALVSRLRLGAHVTFTGQVDNALDLLQVLDASINAARREAFGLALVEAMALEVPVVAVDRAGPSELIDHEVTGLLCPDNQPASLARALERLITDPALGSRLAAAARRRYEERYSATRASADLQETLIGLARR